MTTRNLNDDDFGPSLATRARTWITGAAGASVLLVWVVPELGRQTFNDTTIPLFRIVAGAAEQASGTLHPYVVALVCMAIASWGVSWWANRQRRRLTVQVARAFRPKSGPMIQPGHLRSRVVPGLRAPLRAWVRIPSGFSYDEDHLRNAEDLISRSWHFVYSIEHDELHDRVTLIRAWRRGLKPDVPDNQNRVQFQSAAHERLDEVKDSLPIKVTTVQPVTHSSVTGEPTEYEIKFSPTPNSAIENWQNKVSGALVQMVGRAPEGYTWDTTWYPDNDMVNLSLAEVPPEPEPLPTYVPHPVIDDYESFLGTSRLVIPYATGSVSPYLWWDIDPKSNTPHGLIAGPTGGGKTTAIGTLISGGTRRGIPWILLDPKRFELTQFAYHPGVIGVATSLDSCIDTIDMLWEEKERRSVYREKRPWIENKDMPIFGIVIDEFLLLSFLLQQAAKQDDDLKKADHRGKLNVMVTEIRAVGGRFAFSVQRPDAAIWGGGNARSNLGMRLAMSRNEPDGDDMMFGRQGVTSHLDQSIAGRGMGTNAQGDPEECQVFYTPNLNQHPLVHDKLSPADRALVQQLMPAETPSTSLWTPANDWAFLRPKYTLDMPEAKSEPETVPSAPAGEVGVSDLETAIPARDIEPGARIAAPLDGTMVPATVVADVEPDGSRLAIEVRLDGQRGTETLIVDRDEMIALIEEKAAA